MLTVVVWLSTSVPLEGLKVVPAGPPEADQFRILELPWPIDRVSLHAHPLRVVSNVQSEFASKLC